MEINKHEKRMMAVTDILYSEYYPTFPIWDTIKLEAHLTKSDFTEMEQSMATLSTRANPVSGSNEFHIMHRRGKMKVYKSDVQPNSVIKVYKNGELQMELPLP